MLKAGPSPGKRIAATAETNGQAVAM